MHEYRRDAAGVLGFMSWALLSACSTNAPGVASDAPGVGSYAGTGASCVPGQVSACVSATPCPAGTQASASCQATGVLDPCLCTSATAGASGHSPTAISGLGEASTTAGSGAAPSTAEVTLAAGSGGAAAVGGSGAAGAGAIAPAAVLGSWRMMGYDSNNNYFNPDETTLTVQNAPTLEEKWRFEVSGFPPGTAVIAEGKVFVTATGGTYGLNLADGKLLWSRTDLTATASPAYENGFIYVHTYPGQLYKLNVADGTTVWGPVESNPNDACDGMSSPILGMGMVFVGHSCGELETGTDEQTAMARGGVEAFDTETGTRAWSYYTVPETGENGAMVWSSVAIDIAAKVVFAGTGNNYTVQGQNSDAIHAIDAMTGTRKWKTQVHDDDTWSLYNVPSGPDTDFGANPILADVGGKKIVANGDKGANFYLFDRETGAVLWKREMLSASRNQANGGVLMNGAFDGKFFYVVSNQPPNQAVLHALDPSKQGADAWPPITWDKTTWGAPALANGLLVVPNDDDLYVLNAATGATLKQFNTGGTIAAGAPAIVDGRIVVKSGLSYSLDSTTKNNNLVICYGLPGEAGGPTGPSTTTASGLPKFSAIYTEVITATGCNGGPSCHAGTVAGGLKMTNPMEAYSALVGVKASGMNVPAGGTDCKDTQLLRVAPNDPDNSLIVKKIDTTAPPPCGAHMPPGGMIKPEQIAQIRQWIMNGANND